LSVSRRTELAPEGGYVYGLDTFTNPTALPVTVTVDVRSETRTAVIAASTTASATEGGMLVYDSSANNEISLGLLYAGADAPQAPVVAFDAPDWAIDGNRWPRFTYQITVPAFSSRSLLLFAAIDTPDGAGAIEARLRAIAADPTAAAFGLTAAERARVVNFRLEP
jgi:hypothetical protein